MHVREGKGQRERVYMINGLQVNFKVVWKTLWDKDIKPGDTTEVT